jgi:hypothetical protein
VLYQDTIAEIVDGAGNAIGIVTPGTKFPSTKELNGYVTAGLIAR